MWSERWPVIAKRQTISSVAMSIATTSARLGLETMSRRPSLVEYMSSTNWSLPSPTNWRIARNIRAGRVGVDLRHPLVDVGMMLIRAMRWKSPYGWMTSAVPSQLLPTKIADLVARSTGGGFAGSAAAGAAAASRVSSVIGRLKERRTRPGKR